MDLKTALALKPEARVKWLSKVRRVELQLQGSPESILHKITFSHPIIYTCVYIYIYIRRYICILDVEHENHTHIFWIGFDSTYFLCAFYRTILFGFATTQSKV